MRDWRRTTHRSTLKSGGTTRHRRRRRCRHCAHPRTSPARSLSGHRGGSRRMSARFVTAWSGGRADTARRCVPKQPCRASVVRRGSAEHPTDHFPRPCAESDRGMPDRSVVVQGAASGGAGIGLVRRDASARQWLAGPARAPPATGATTIAKTATAHDRLGENAYSNERGRRVGGAEQESRAGGPDASPKPTEPQYPS
jgi:hypothetical protein